jgi:hypothetical protein
VTKGRPSDSFANFNDSSVRSCPSDRQILADSIEILIGMEHDSKAITVPQRDGQRWIDL